MIVMRSEDDAEVPRYRYTSPRGGESWAVNYFGAKTASAGDSDEQSLLGVFHPVAYYVEVEPNFESLPHFHVADQFQVFVAGDGGLGKHPALPITVHYASAYSPYGPVRASAAGLSYFTLRNGYDRGPHYMPASRSELRRANRRPQSMTSEPITLEDLTRLWQAGEAKQIALIEEHSDGLGAWHHHVPPTMTALGSAPNAGGGQYWLVISGGGEVDGVALSRYSFLFLAPDESAVSITAGADGLDVLALQFPAREWKNHGA